jgi:arginase
LRGLDGAPDPLVRPGDCVVIGSRFDPGDDAADERELAHPLIQQISGPQLRAADAAEIGDAIAERLARQAGAIWLHIDCDVLDEAVMPAVTYAQPGGASWDELEALVRSAAVRPELIGVSLADFVPAKDPGGEHAARLVQVVASSLSA